MSKNLITLFSLSLALVAASSALAEDVSVTSDALSMPVSYADLNVSSIDGAKTLLTRIERAASLVCGSEPFIRDLKSNMDYKSCVEDAVASAVASSGLPTLAALYDAPAITLAQK